MRLKHIRLSGFKSFVDTTKISLPSNLIGIVGPNGCGKSNVIDAIRWVMGESSAKTLRGDRMEDVIFNGSSVRKPVNRAFVELLFDNVDGKAPGEYAKFAEIAIRRELDRAAGSKYFINKTLCRRKDIHDLFLGTGLGPRSYSIIEQGMVSRIVESKPEDLRVLLEEAAGISKYKERRRETENRMRHTRDNLSRVNDIITELEGQLRRLKRQSNAAERYKKHKTQQRELESQVKTLQWSGLHEQVKSKDVELERLKTEFEAHLAEQRDIESKIEAMRLQQVDLADVLNNAQADYYSIGGEVTVQEQTIQHTAVSRRQHKEELERLSKSTQQATQHLENDQSRLTETKQKILELTPVVETLATQYEQTKDTFSAAERAYRQWQDEWETLNRDAANPEKDREVQSTRVEQHQRQIQHLKQRLVQTKTTFVELEDKLKLDELSRLQIALKEADQLSNSLEKDLREKEQKLTLEREELEKNREHYNLVRHQLQDDSAQLTSLRALQAAALGEDNIKVNEWLQARSIRDNPRLASKLRVDNGWEAAVDAVLGRHLNASTVPKIEQYTEDMIGFDGGRISLVDQGFASLEQRSPVAIVNRQLSPRDADLDLLLDKVSTEDMNIDGWFHGVFAANSLADALAARKQLDAHESIVTRDGSWLGSNWISFGSNQDADAGILQREAQIAALVESTDLAKRSLQKIGHQGDRLQEQIAGQEAGLEKCQSNYRIQSQAQGELHNQLGAIDARNKELRAQLDNVQIEQGQLTKRLAAEESGVGDANRLMHDARQRISDFAQTRQQLTDQRQQLADELDKTRIQERQARDDLQTKQIEFERLQSNQILLSEGIVRLQQQQNSQSARSLELRSILDQGYDPNNEQQEQLQGLLESRINAETRLSKARTELEEFDDQLRSAEQARLSFERNIKTARDGLEEVRMARQEVAVRRNTISEAMHKNTSQMTLLQQQLPRQSNLAEVETRLRDTVKKIERIGAVNLVAIDEHEQCEERKVYLDSQQADLLEAMQTLETAMNKIDKETTTRFKETFENLNSGFGQFFPKLFGGGSAYLELTGTDMLDTGVVVMARPPGKRNSTIHLLSGGEKALTAVSLLFAFFELNPAPFCVLDEVDAPLDDVNVERYSGVLEQLGKKTQLLFITHNKITMEVSDILIGVTMAEPGVSRLVTVDVGEAVALAAR